MDTGKDADKLFNLAHDLNNSFSSVYGSLRVIQNRHPEVADFPYWQETIQDLEEAKNQLSLCLTEIYRESGIKENT